MNGKQPLSLYWHIPFCSKKCGYCHFYVLPDKEFLKDELLEGLNLEWRSIAPLLPQSEVVSIYFGGGTPALFGPKRLQEILSWIHQRAPTCEITLEANPEELTVELLRDYRTLGINRLSIGVQSLDDGLLSTLTRQHNAHKALSMVEAAAASGFDNITIDLMYDVPGQTLATWRKTLAQATQLPITHLSLYNLTIEPHTQFDRQKEQLKPRLPDTDTSQQMYEEAVMQLTASGLDQYEVSAFARSGFESRHNSGYWTGRPFYGFGPSAFSYVDNARFRNVANQRVYLEKLRGGQTPIDFREVLSDDERRRELLVIQLRLVTGIDLELFTQLHGPLEKQTLGTLSQLIGHGLLLRTGAQLQLTHRGRLCYDSVATELV